MIPILLVDDHSVVREGLRHILEEGHGILCSVASSGEEAIEIISSGKLFQVVLMDISLPGISGLEALKEIKLIRPNLAILMLSMHPEERFAVRAMRQGAAGYLSKSSPSEEIIKAVKLVATEGRYISKRLAIHLAKNQDNPLSLPAHESLSEREFQVLCLIGAGKPPSDIARSLSLSVKTVSTLRERMMRKMNFTGSMEIIRYTLQEGLLDGN